MSRQILGATAIGFTLLLVLGGVIFWGLHGHKNPHQVLAQSTTSDASGGSSLNVESSSAVPLGNLPGENTGNSSTPSASSTSSGGIATTNQGEPSPTTTPSANSSTTQTNPLDPSTFQQYDKYKDSTSVLYGELSPGTGTVAASGKTLTVLYRGWLTNGQLFDQNVSTAKPFSFVLGAGTVIPGWEEGFAGMKVGGERLLIVPPAVGYGATAHDPIPANSVLIFDVKLLGVS